MDSQNVDRGRNMNQDTTIVAMPTIEPPNSVQPNAASNLSSSLQSGTVESQALAEHSVAFKIVVGAFFFMTLCVIGSVKSVSLSTASAGVVFGQGSMFQDACYIEYVETRKLWRAANPPSNFQFRPVLESELTPGCKDLIVKAGCSLMTSAGTPPQEARPIEVPFGLLVSMKLSLGFDIAHRGYFLVFGPRVGRPIRITVAIMPDVDENGEDSFTAALNIQVGHNVLKSKIQVTESETQLCISYAKQHVQNYSFHGQWTREGTP